MLFWKITFFANLTVFGVSLLCSVLSWALGHPMEALAWGAAFMFSLGQIGFLAFTYQDHMIYPYMQHLIEDHLQPTPQNPLMDNGEGMPSDD